VAPSLQPDLFSGVPLVVTGRWRGHSGGTIAVTGTSSDGTPFQNRVAATTGGNPASTAAWARAHLRDLEDRYASLTGHGTAELGRLEQQIAGVSLRFGVLCRFTAFVAVDSRVVTDGAGPHRVTQPVEQPSGWQPTGPGQQPMAAMPLAAMPLGAMAPMAAAAPMASPPMAPPPMGLPPMGPRPMAGAPMAGAPMAGAPMAGAPMAGAPMAGAPAGGAPAGGKRVAGMRARAAGRREPQAGDAPRLVGARRQMADEAAELRAVHGAPDTERARLLGDLGTRIDALLAWLAAERAADQLTGLAELAGKLRACDRPGAPRGAELDALWQEAIRVLTGFAGGADRGAPREWWKRTR
jgi:Ca-activated chloride channel homolog